MRYELSDYEWTAIKPMLPNKPRGVRRVNDRRVLNGIARNLIERFFNKIKQCRRVATRYDKLAANYLAFVKLASIRIWLRANESTP
jgi:transposase